MEELRTSVGAKGLEVVPPLEPEPTMEANADILFFNTSRSNANGLTYFARPGGWIKKEGISVDFIVVRLPEKVKTRGDAKVLMESWFGSQDVTLLKSLGNSEWQIDTLVMDRNWKHSKVFDEITWYIDRSKGIGTIWTTFWKERGNNNYPNVSFHWSLT
jgi:hypothetical protein